MRLGIWLSAGGSWADLIDTASHAQASGWDAVYLADDFSEASQSPSGPGSDAGLEAWTCAAAIAASVPRVAIGVVATRSAHRHPGVLAKMAATLDQLSNGRHLIGFTRNPYDAPLSRGGTGSGRPWDPRERFEEALEVVTALLGSSRTNFDGRYFRLDDAPCEPKPVQARLPVLLDGAERAIPGGLVARFADCWSFSGTPAELQSASAALDGECRRIGRDPSTVSRMLRASVLIRDEPGEASDPPGHRPAGVVSVAGRIGDVGRAIRSYLALPVSELLVDADGLGAPGSQRFDTMDQLADELADVHTNGPLR